MAAISEWGPTTSYSDNFIIVVLEERGAAEMERTPVDLSDLLITSVVFYRAGMVARCLELRLYWTAEEKAEEDDNEEEEEEEV